MGRHYIQIDSACNAVCSPDLEDEGQQNHNPKAGSKENRACYEIIH